MVRLLLLKDALHWDREMSQGKEVREAPATVRREEGNWDQEERGKWTTGKNGGGEAPSAAWAMAGGERLHRV